MAVKQENENTPLFEGDGFEQIGSALKKARLSEGLSVKEVSEQLRISVDFLTKLEAGAFNELPAPAYVIGFLRSYGRSVGLAPDSLIARYMAITEGEDSKPSYKIPMSTRPPQRSAPVVASVLVLCAVMVYGGWFWLKNDSLSVLDMAETGAKTAMLSRDHERTVIDVTSLDPPAKVDRIDDNLADTVEAPVVVSAAGTTRKPLVSVLDTTKDNATDKPTLERAPNEKTAPEPTASESSVVQTVVTGLEKTDLTGRESQIPVLPAVEASNRVLPDELAKTQMLTTPDPASLDMRNSNIAIANLRDPAKEITIRAVAASWVEIVRDNGEEVLAKLMQAGDSYVVEGNTSLFLSTGNAGGLMVVIGTDDPLLMGDIGEIVRDLPLVTDKLRKAL